MLNETTFFFFFFCQGSQTVSGLLLSHRGYSIYIKKRGGGIIVSTNIDNGRERKVTAAMLCKKKKRQNLTSTAKRQDNNPSSKRHRSKEIRHCPCHVNDVALHTHPTAKQERKKKGGGHPLLQWNCSRAMLNSMFCSTCRITATLVGSSSGQTARSSLPSTTTLTP